MVPDGWTECSSYEEWCEDILKLPLMGRDSPSHGVKEIATYCIDEFGGVPPWLKKDFHELPRIGYMFGVDESWQTFEIPFNREDTQPPGKILYWIITGTKGTWYSDDCEHYHFHDPGDALKFKLTWF